MVVYAHAAELRLKLTRALRSKRITSATWRDHHQTPRPQRTGERFVRCRPAARQPTQYISPSSFPHKRLKTTSMLCRPRLTSPDRQTSFRSTGPGVPHAALRGRQQCQAPRRYNRTDFRVALIKSRALLYRAGRVSFSSHAQCALAVPTRRSLLCILFLYPLNLRVSSALFVDHTRPHRSIRLRNNCGRR